MDKWDVVVGILWAFSALASYGFGFLSGEYKTEMKVLRLLFKIMDTKDERTLMSAALIIAASLKKNFNANKRKNHNHPQQDRSFYSDIGGSDLRADK